MQIRGFVDYNTALILFASKTGKFSQAFRLLFWSAYMLCYFSDVTFKTITLSPIERSGFSPCFRTQQNVFVKQNGPGYG